MGKIILENRWSFVIILGLLLLDASLVLRYKEFREEITEKAPELLCDEQGMKKTNVIYEPEKKSIIIQCE